MGTDLSKQEAGNWKGDQETGDTGQERQQKGEGKGKMQKGRDGKRTPRAWQSDSTTTDENRDAQTREGPCNLRVHRGG